MLVQTLQKRYTCKAYDPSRKLSDEQVNYILEAIRLAPTSSGLQPFHVLRIKSAEAREAVKQSMMNSNIALIENCSDILVLAAWGNYTEERIDAVYAQHNELRPALQEGQTAYAESLKRHYIPRGAEVNHVHTARQAYITLGLALAAAEEQGVYATPIEGYQPEVLDSALGLEAKDLKSLFVIALGLPDTAGDWNASQKKVRRTLDQLVIEL